MTNDPNNIPNFTIIWILLSLLIMAVGFTTAIETKSTEWYVCGLTLIILGIPVFNIAMQKCLVFNHGQIKFYTITLAIIIGIVLSILIWCDFGSQENRFKKHPNSVKIANSTTERPRENTYVELLGIDASLPFEEFANSALEKLEQPDDSRLCNGYINGYAYGFNHRCFYEIAGNDTNKIIRLTFLNSYCNTDKLFEDATRSIKNKYNVKPGEPYHNYSKYYRFDLGGSVVQVWRRWNRPELCKEHNSLVSVQFLFGSYKDNRDLLYDELW